MPSNVPFPSHRLIEILFPLSAANYFGMIDQLVSSRGKIFFGCWFSTFTGYIDRIRGYHSVKDKLPGYKSGALPTTYYYATIDRKLEMHKVSIQWPLNV